jgi:hypothetical protein
MEFDRHNYHWKNQTTTQDTTRTPNKTQKHQNTISVEFCCFVLFCVFGFSRGLFGCCSFLVGFT